MLFNFSVAVEDAFREVEASSPRRNPNTGVGVGGGSKVDEGSRGVGAFPEPGCLKIPKLIDFFWG